MLGLRSVMTTALDSDWFEARKGKDKATYVREKTLRSGERLKRRTQRQRQLRTVHRESADDRLTSATEKTMPALSA